ncbi:peptidase A24 [Gardnerella vaginalis]|uniref:peptidase A24 n=1 Tax=Gardnerella vaginalis TaxID=2702 RepID=UPI000C9C4FD3|nr:peptidase A24 [Gardnerella vaginalis]PMC49873.1 peptidase A24 [Gardnerella vaginalis]
MSQFIIACLFAAPTLVCTIALCATDLVNRVVPRLWVLLAAFAQSAANLIFSLITFHNVNFLLRGWLCAVTVFAIYVLTQKLCVRGALGFGDVTCASMIAQALALFGFDCIIYWFALVGIFGLIWILVWKICSKVCLRFFRVHLVQNEQNKIPFVPVLAASSIIAVMFCGFCCSLSL